MPHLQKTETFPTYRRIRLWLDSEYGSGGRNLLWSVGGIACIVVIATAMLLLASRQHALDERRNLSLEAFRVASEAENNLHDLETNYHGFLQTGLKTEVEEFQRHQAVFLERTRQLVSVVRVQLGSHAEIRSIADDFQTWLATVAMPNIQARQQRRDAPLVSPPAGKAAADRLHAAMGRLVKACSDEYRDASAAARIQQYFQIGGVVILSLGAVGFLVMSTLSGIASFKRHLAKTEAACQQTKAIIATTLDGVVTIDSQGLIVSMNPAAEAMFVSPASEMVGKNISVLIPQRLIFHDMNQISRGSILTTGQRQGYYPFPIEISLSEMTVGGRRQFVALIRDVGERKRTEDTLKQIANSVSGVTGDEFVRTLAKELSKTLMIDYAFVVEVSGRGDEAVTIVTVAAQGNIQSSSQHDLSRTACGEALAKGFRAHLSEVREKFPEDAILASLGAESFVGMPLTDHDRRTVGLMGVICRKPIEDTGIIEAALQIVAARAGAEIERKRFEDDLAAEKERLAVTLRSIGEGFITIDNEGKVLLMNAVAENLVGFTQERAAGKHLQDIFQLLHERTRRRCQHGLLKIVETGTSDEISYPALLVSQDGTERLVECTTTPIRDKTNRKFGVVIVFRDVTDRLRIEQERQKAEKLESLGLVAGGIAHDFNNLLMMILGNVSFVLEEKDIAQKTLERLNAAKKATARAQELAGQLLTFAKGGAPVKQTVSLGKLIRDTVACTLKGSKVWCETTLPEDLWSVDIDPGQISQVINNLVVNADQAMPAGGTVRIVAENVELAVEHTSLGIGAGRWVCVSVQDEGIGIAAEYIKKVFDPYFTTKPKGSGMGLATAYSIVNSHGGVIAVKSPPGSGANFSIYLPASEAPIQTAETVEVEARHRPARVLVLDDEEAICMIIQCTLEELGYEVVATHDGKDAVAAYEKEFKAGRPYDLVISDLTIPGGMGGKEAIARLCEIDPNVCAIVSSGYANDPIMSRYQDYGFTAMIAKPYEIAALGRKVAEVLSLPRKPKAVIHDERKTA